MIERVRSKLFENFLNVMIEYLSTTLKKIKK